MPASDEFARGEEKGRTEAILEAHSEHLAKINGSVDRMADTAVLLSNTIRSLESVVRSMQEEARLAEARVKVAAETLAAVTDQKAKELATKNAVSDRRWTRREQTFGLMITITGIALGWVAKTKGVL